MAESQHLYGSCACERNQYTIVIPSTTAKQVQVFFDNTAANRRSQATPLSAWLRVPLDWYHSSTFAHFPDETHKNIKRAFDDPAVSGPTRRQFCGFCGTHLTAWSESGNAGASVNVTLGSLESASLQVLESMGVYDHDLADAASNVGDAAASTPATSALVNQHERSPQSLHNLQGRGLPFFEDMVEHSRLGRIRRQKGGHDSADGTRRVEWEVVEILGDGSDESMGEAGSETPAPDPKRPRLGL